MPIKNKLIDKLQVYIKFYVKLVQLIQCRSTC